MNEGLWQNASDEEGRRIEQANGMKVVVDTSIFINPEVHRQFGATPDAAVRRFFQLTQKQGYQIYMPRSIKAELDNFLSPKAAQVVERHAVIRSPSKHELFIPSWLFYEFIEEMRFRINKGLRLAERAARTMGEEDIKALRQQYREDLRSGILDSKEDLDIVLLAKELSAAVISADEGVKKWADKMGLHIIETAHLKNVLNRRISSR